MGQKKLFALLVSEGNHSLDELKTLLNKQAIETWSAETCAEVERLLEQTHPELVFTGENICDGTWADIVSLTERTSVPTNVIVVGNCKDTGLYLSTMNYGAFDFILPPFEHDPVAHIVRVAAENVRRRREQQAIKAVA